MKMPNANRVCEMVGGYLHCNECPLLKECESNPEDPKDSSDWEERIEKAATEYLKGKENE